MFLCLFFLLSILWKIDFYIRSGWRLHLPCYFVNLAIITLTQWLTAVFRKYQICVSKFSPFLLQILLQTNIWNNSSMFLNKFVVSLFFFFFVQMETRNKKEWKEPPNRSLVLLFTWMSWLKLVKYDLGFSLLA